MALSAFNLTQRIDRHAHLLKAPVGNQQVFMQAEDHSPGHYLDRFCVDSAVFDPRALRLLLDMQGLSDSARRFLELA